MKLVEAEEYANRVVKGFMEADDDWKLDEKSLFFLWSFKCRHEQLERGWLFTAPPECIDRMCELSIFYPDVRPVLRRLLSSKLEHGFALTEAESQVAGMMLAGKLPDAFIVRTGRKKSENLERNVLILMLAKHLRDEFGLKFTRNDEAKEHNSAADVIARAFEANKRPDVPLVTYRAIKEVFASSFIRKYVESIERQIREALDYQKNHNHMNALAPRPSAVPEYMRKFPS